MSTLQRKWMNDTSDRVLNLLWKQWCLLGVSGNQRGNNNPSNTTILLDPEALLLATMIIARRDPRLFDEVLDWSVTNGRWLSLQRMKNLNAQWQDTTLNRLFSAYCSWMAMHESKGRWARTRFATVGEDLQSGQIHETPLFLDDADHPLPLLTVPDAIFSDFGLLRPTVRIRGLSQKVPMQTREALLFRMRSLFGLNPRAEVITILLSRGEETLIGLVQFSGYSRASVGDVLKDLIASGEIEEIRQSGRKTWRISSDSLIEQISMAIYSDSLQNQIPEVIIRSTIWVNWFKIYQTLILLDREMRRLSRANLSDESIGAELCVLSDQIGDILSDVGIETPFAKRLNFAQATTGFESRVNLLFRLLEND